MKALTGIICSRSSDKVIPIYQEVSEEEHKRITENWGKAFLNIFYDPVVKELEKKKEKNDAGNV